MTQTGSRHDLGSASCRRGQHLDDSGQITIAVTGSVCSLEVVQHGQWQAVINTVKRLAKLRIGGLQQKKTPAEADRNGEGSRTGILPNLVA